MALDVPERLYKGVIRIAKPLLRWHLRRRIPRGKEIASRLGERYGFASKPRPQGRLVWLHGASNGESLALLPIVEQLRTLSDPPAILVTSGTVTSAALLPGITYNTTPTDYAPIKTLRLQKFNGETWDKIEDVTIQ